MVRSGEGEGYDRHIYDRIAHNQVATAKHGRMLLCALFYLAAVHLMMLRFVCRNILSIIIVPAIYPSIVQCYILYFAVRSCSMCMNGLLRVSTVRIQQSVHATNRKKRGKKKELPNDTILAFALRTFVCFETQLLQSLSREYSPCWWWCCYTAFSFLLDCCCAVSRRFDCDDVCDDVMILMIDGRQTNLYGHHHHHHHHQCSQNKRR